MTAVNSSYEISQRSLASQNKEELEILLETLFKINLKTILEIGIDQGGSIKTWREVFPRAWIMGIDINPLAKNSDCNEFWLMDSVNAIDSVSSSILERGGLNFLFIDGDHTERGCQTDFDLYSPLVKPGGVIAFHDVWLRDHPSVEVYKVWDRVKKLFSYKEFKFRGGTGTGVLFV